jgi:BMFP domain-containing protein YqiC
MAPRSNFMADLAQMADGAASALGGMREEVDNLIRQRMERSLNARGLVTREEFDALRTRHEALAARLALLETTNQPVTESQADTIANAKPALKRKVAPKKEQQIIDWYTLTANQRKSRKKHYFMWV